MGLPATKDQQAAGCGKAGAGGSQRSAQVLAQPPQEVAQVAEGLLGGTDTDETSGEEKPKLHALKVYLGAMGWGGGQRVRAAAAGFSRDCCQPGPPQTMPAYPASVSMHAPTPPHEFNSPRQCVRPPPPCRAQCLAAGRPAGCCQVPQGPPACPALRGTVHGWVGGSGVSTCAGRGAAWSVQRPWRCHLFTAGQKGKSGSQAEGCACTLTCA